MVKDRLLQSYKYISHKNKKIEDILKSFFLLHPNNIDLSLARIKKLLDKLNNPQKKIKNIVHIAGTNGKGSIATILYYLQKYQGKTVNIYRSPHLISFNERIHIKNKEVSNQYLLDILEYVKEVNDQQPITFFEIITAATFYMFYENLADLTILEVGLGGQFDATNIIENNLVSIISTIGIDHKEFLGNTIKAITSEKVGIIKKKSCVISSKQTISAKRIIKKKSEEMGSKLYQYNENWKVKNNFFYSDDLQINLEKISLIGRHQHINASCALMACIKVKKLNIEHKGLYKVFSKMYWPGRLEKISSNLLPNYSNLECWVDVAHNKLGFTVLVEWIKRIKMN
ncbi:MAG: Mur ligase family protein, partial [Pseudomonadota bacterium]|nr:Mur ligase family protein [Pseudomonadota bacterium]